MKIILEISVLYLIYFGSLKCTNEFEINHPIRAELVCKEDYNLFNEQCYKLMKYDATQSKFDNAEAECVAEGGHLASIHDGETNQFLLYMVKPDKVLLGLQFVAADGGEPETYKWRDGETYDDFKNFPSGYDEYTLRNYFGDCVMMNGDDGRWVNKKCVETDLPHICQIPVDVKATEIPPTEVAPNECPPERWYTEASTISSPGYPYDYDGDNGALNCSYIFAGPGPITIKFTELSNCGAANSVISIYEGMFEQGTPFEKLTGDLYSLPKSIKTTQQSMFMRFASNGQGKWRAELTVEP